MPQPKDSSLPEGVHLTQGARGSLIISDQLVELLLKSRADYDWPEGTGADKSQQTILDLEAEAETLLTNPDASAAHTLIQRVSIWGGNNKKAQKKIDQAGDGVQTAMLDAVKCLTNPATLEAGIDKLCALPGLRLVMATKVYRFCCPSVGAAVDRHASYFFNSLPVMNQDGTCSKATAFRREWQNGKHTTSRLAIYTIGGYEANRGEYLGHYVPLLSSIAAALNAMGERYNCAATGHSKPWRPADVEMAAYYWWARNGAR